MYLARPTEDLEIDSILVTKGKVSKIRQCNLLNRVRSEFLRDLPRNDFKIVSKRFQILFTKRLGSRHWQNSMQKFWIQTTVYRPVYRTSGKVTRDKVKKKLSERDKPVDRP